MRCPACDARCPASARVCPDCGERLEGGEDTRATIASPSDGPLASSLLDGRQADPASEPAPPEIPGYDIVRKLGEGGMGVVYLARQVELGREVALKVLAPSLARDRSLIERFRREARLLASIHHPAIVAIHELLERDGRFCIVMHYVDGGTLKQRVRAGPLPESLAIDLCCQAARGLWAAAQQGLVHRDIKPDNLLLTAQGKLMIGDFGLAKAAEESSGLTRTGSMMGTPAYMPPEQWNDGRETDHRSDLYALGCTLYEMLAGHPPFRGPTTANFTKQHCLNSPPDLRSACPDAHPALAGIVARLLAKDPADRFQTGEELASALENLDAQPRLRRPRRSHSSGLWVALLAGLVALVLFFSTLSRGTDRAQPIFPDPPSQPAESAQRSRAQGLLKTVDQHLTNARYLTSPEDRARRQEWLEQAVDASQRAVALAGDLADAHFFLGRSYQAREQWDRALAAYEAALACDAGHHEALYRHILGLHAQLNRQGMGSPMGNTPGLLQRMREDLAKLLLLDVPADWIATAQGLVAYGELGERLALAMNGVSTEDLWRDLAAELQEYGEQVLAANQGNPWGHVLLNWAASNLALANSGGLGANLRAEEWAPSIQHMERAIRLQPNNVYFRQQLVWMYLAADREPEAEAHARETVALAPFSSEAHNLLGNVLLQLGLEVGGWQALDEALRLASDPGPIYVSRAMVRLGDPVQANQMSYWQPSETVFQAALAELDAALAVDPDEPLALWIKGNLLWLSMRDVPAGTEIFARLAELTPDSFVGKMAAARATMPAAQHPLEQWRLLDEGRLRQLAALPRERRMLLDLFPSWRARVAAAEDLDPAQRRATLQSLIYWQAAILASEERPDEALVELESLLQTGWHDWPALDAESAFVTLRGDSAWAALRARED